MNLLLLLVFPIVTIGLGLWIAVETIRFVRVAFSRRSSSVQEHKP